ncbi:helix-turn-helix domain-containing protein [Paenibacillus sp. LjRoot153]|uniref:helix-turn-helix domain-containing protein n=1 Tax=Paenibacillus sp. LjRoot153 TaxID=3342270 RepID=UPI003F502BC8
MLQHKAYRFRIYPTKEQENVLRCRFVFNHFLSKWKDAYYQTGKGLSYYACATQLLLKADFSWLEAVDSIALQSAVRNVADSFDRSLSKPHD